MKILDRLLKYLWVKKISKFAISLSLDIFLHDYEDRFLDMKRKTKVLSFQKLKIAPKSPSFRIVSARMDWVCINLDEFKIKITLTIIMK